ncbi:uroporphyrinogen-III synthase [Acetobacteraceae bacterium]|nr:uroporphyrinogen-III synthase [Acetobacteraceae bacterium]
MKILVTRPEPGLSQLMARLVALKKEPIAAPMLQIEISSPLAPIFGNTILITSSHALPALKRQDRNCRILSVGESTAQKAKELGFRHVFSAGGNAEKLKNLYEKMGCTAKDSWLAIGCGNNEKLYGDFLVKSLGIRRFKTYQVRWTSSLSKEVRDFLKQPIRKQILFYSSETVRSFFNLIQREEKKTDFQIDRGKIEIFCFSPEIAKILKEDAHSLEWARIEDNLSEIFK